MVRPLVSRRQMMHIAVHTIMWEVSKIMFDHPFGAALPTVESVTVEDPVGNQPSNIIQSTDPWRIRVKWSLGLPGAPWAGAFTYQVRAYLESIGLGFEDQVGPTVSVPGKFVAPFDFEALINVPAGLPVGSYKLTTLVNAVFPGNVPAEMAAFVEGPIVQIYQFP